MTDGRASPPSERLRRLTACRKVAAERGGTREAASELGIKQTTLIAFLHRHAPDLLRQLSRAPGRRSDPHAALVRLLLMKGFEGHLDTLARGLGITVQALAIFKARWAPDGLDAAIADLMPEGSDVQA